MATWQYEPTAVADMLAAFPVKALEPIEDKPTLHTLLQRLKVLCRCSQKVKSGLGPLGYLFVALPQEHYVRFTNVPLVVPGPTPMLPNFDILMGPAERDRAKLQWQAHRAENENINNMNEALTGLFLAAIRPEFQRHLDNDLVGITTQPFWTIFTSFLERYGQITPYDIQANRKRMEDPWIQGEPVEKLFAQINDAYEYGVFSGHNISEADMVQAGEILVLNHGNYASEYKDWRALPAANRTWDEFTTFWQKAYNLKSETETQAASLNFSAYMEKVEDNETVIDDAVNTFGEAFAANSTVISQLTETNSTLNANVSKNINDLQQQMASMNLALQNLAAAGRSGASTRTQRPHPPPMPPTVPPLSAVNTPPFQPMQQWNRRNLPPHQQPPHAYQPMHSFGGTYTRNRGRGGGRGGGRGNRSQFFEQPILHGNWQNQGNNFMQHVPPLTPQVHNVPYSNRFKKFNNWNYCWTHGFDIGDNHHSGNCLRPAPGHVWTATRQNPCGGSTRNQHKIINNPSYNYSHNTSSANENFDDDDNVTVKTSNKSNDKMKQTNVNYDEYGLMDSGTTDHFLTVSSSCKNVRDTTHHINIIIPNGNNMTSTQECDIDWPDLPPAARTGRIVPSLRRQALISVVKLTDAGCDVIFRKNCCIVFHNGNLVLWGVKCPYTKLWLVPLTAKRNRSYHQQRPSKQMVMNSMQHITSQKNLIDYLHQCFFSPTKTTLLKAIKNNNLVGVPGLTEENVNKYLKPSVATLKGHLHRTRKNLRSTRATHKQDMNEQILSNLDLNPHEEPNARCEIFCYAALANEIKGTIYTDLTGRFPIRSYKGNQYIFLTYVYDANAIIVRPMKNRTKEEQLRVFHDVYDYLKHRRFEPCLHIMDNECSKTIQDFIARNKTSLQLVEPHQHRVNAAERAIQTFKNHFVAGLCTVDKAFPLQLWCDLLPQAEMTVNLLRQSRINNKLSAHACLEGIYNFDKIPLAPPGSKALVYQDPKTRKSWAPHAQSGWYVGPAPQHYRCYKFWIPETKGYRIGQTARIFPAYTTTPTMTGEEYAILTARDLVLALKNLKKKGIFNLKPTHKEALMKIVSIFNDALPPTHKNNNLENHDTGPPRVKTIDNTFSSPQTNEDNTPPRVDKHYVENINKPQMKSKDVFNKDNIIHQRRTRANTPIVTKDDNRYPRRSLRTPRIISQSAISHMCANTFTFLDAFTPLKLKENRNMVDIEHVCNGVVHPVSGEVITNYKKLIADKLLKSTWEEAMCIELGRLAQGYNNTQGTNTVRFMSLDMIKDIPIKQTVTYGRIVVDYRPQKEDPNRVRITAGGNLIKYPDELTTRTADLTTTKLLWNSVLSTQNAKYMCIDIKNMYLATPLDRYEYMKMPTSIIPAKIMDIYKLHDKIHNNFIYMRIERGMYGLPQAGILANKLLRQRLEPHGYYEATHTPGLWLHKTLPIKFTLVVDDFGVQYVGKESAKHLIDALKTNYDISEDWTGSLYCGISLHWNYTKRYLDTNMPGYTNKNLNKFGHEKPTRKQHTPFVPAPRQYGKEAQKPEPPDTSPPLDDSGKKRIQRIVGTYLYYGRAVDRTILNALSNIASHQEKPTEKTKKASNTFLDYMATYPEATTRYYASDMILNVHSDASYLTAPKGRSRIGGHFFLGSQPVDNEPIKLNAPILSMCGILRLVAMSAAEAELGALFVNAREAKIIRLTLLEMGYPQPCTPVHIDNTTVTGIVNNTIKRQRSRAMEMRYFWLLQQEQQKIFKFIYQPGQENLANYYTKAFTGKEMLRQRPFYVHMKESPRILHRANLPHTRRGCVKSKRDQHYNNGPLPIIPTR